MGIQILKIKTDGVVFGHEEVLTPMDFIYFDCEHYSKVYDNVVMACGGRMKAIQEIKKIILESRRELEVFSEALENAALIMDEHALDNPEIDDLLYMLSVLAIPEYKLTERIPFRVYGAPINDLKELIQISAKSRCLSDLNYSFRSWDCYWEKA